MANGFRAIEEICSVMTGAPNSMFEREVTKGSPTIKLLSGNAVSELGEISLGELMEVQPDANKNIERLLLRAGDVVLLARGSAMRAGLITPEIAAEQVIPSTNFVILRPDPSHLIGEVLVAYLNSVAGQAVLDSISKGTALKSASASAVKKIEIPLPPLTKQHEIAELFYASNDAFHAGVHLTKQQLVTAKACMANLIQGEI